MSGELSQQKLQPLVFRFNLSTALVDALLQFSKMHQHDHCETYKEAWALWKSQTDVSILLESEIERLKTLGYKGDAESIEKKIFKSGRYYFRNKSFTNAPPTKRGKYIPMSKALINVMDDHIMRFMKYNFLNTNTTNINVMDEGATATTATTVTTTTIQTPASLFTHFCQTCVTTLREEIERLIDHHDYHSSSSSEIISKIKKTYKNRVFNISKKLFI